MLKSPFYYHLVSLHIAMHCLLLFDDMEICSICGVLDVTPGGSWQGAPQFDEGLGGQGG